MPQVSPSVLQWARETAGLSVEEAADKIGLTPARGVVGPDRLRAIEAGHTVPSRPLLVRMAQQYRRPLLTLYLPSPPPKGDRGQDFRTLPSEVSKDTSAFLDALIRDIQVRQDIVRSTLDLEDEATPLSFVASSSIADGVDEVADRIRDELGFSIQQFRSSRTAEDAFTYLRRLVEQSGIFVLLAGNLGSHHSSIDVDVFRGFAIADKVAPFVVINDQDASTAWSFTLLHEAAHIWLGETGISGGYAGIELEKFCSDVASELLLQSRELNSVAIARNATSDMIMQAISTFAQERRISHSLVAYRLFRLGRIDDVRWREVNSRLSQLWKQARSDQRARNREREGGPNYYVVRRHRLGGALLAFTERMVRSGALTHTRAAKVLGVKATNLEKLFASGPPTVV
jgi:Zn-dependent peptidase ImmA (M78 family)/transcriptional regulator with XRE-family HTH domain